MSPLVGYVASALAALPLLLPLPIPTAAALYLMALYLVTGVTHADGLADLGDAAVVYSDADRRLSVLEDSQTGVGDLLAFRPTLVVLTLGAFSLAGAGDRVGLAAAVAIALAAEVGTKADMATLVRLGMPAYGGLDSTLVDENSSAGLLVVAVACLPVVVLVPVVGGPAVVAALCCGPVVALLVRSWGRARLGGASGDLLNAANKLACAATVRAGVVTRTLS